MRDMENYQMNKKKKEMKSLKRKYQIIYRREEKTLKIMSYMADSVVKN